ncbi:hypothetical protein BD410DRAFT_316708 [Rickenella mellea]|uniref:Uncharacterized protein n=1 Tax=Rickenella mellea TaxID=50990 RepID=A0A4Y7Q0H7_9AGAM|nr:hypothetical protein BD410DRAFT_316708 [Rickenella mellea]
MSSTLGSRDTSSSLTASCMATPSLLHAYHSKYLAKTDSIQNSKRAWATRKPSVFHHAKSVERALGDALDWRLGWY